MWVNHVFLPPAALASGCLESSKDSHPKFRSPGQFGSPECQDLPSSQTNAQPPLLWSKEKTPTFTPSPGLPETEQNTWNLIGFGGPQVG